MLPRRCGSRGQARWSRAAPPASGRRPRAPCTRRGASVVIADLNAEKGEALAAELGERAGFVEANVMEPEPVQAAVDAAADAEGGLRISVCCAGIGWAQRTAGKQGPHDLEIFHNVIKVNLIGTFNVLRLAGAGDGRQRARRGGRARRLRQHRLDRRLRRPDRPGRLLGLEGRHRRPDAARRPRPRQPRRPRRDDRARACSTRRCSAALPEEARDELGPPDPLPAAASASPRSTPRSPATSSRTRC